MLKVYCIGAMLSLVAFIAPAQVKIIIPEGVVLNDAPSPELEIDSAIYKVSYRMSYLPDTTQFDSRKEGYVNLYIGKNNRSLFIDRYEVEFDSLMPEVQRKGGDPLSVSLKGLTTKVFDQVLAIDYPDKGEVLFQQYGGEYKRYIDDNATQNWVIRDTTEDILGYVCRVATTTYRGRDYEAWFAEEIPLAYGPYVFRGLPGLIFKIYDIDHEYEFSLIGFETVEHPFKLTIEDSDPVMMTRDEFRKLERAYHEDPMISMEEGVSDLKLYEGSSTAGKEIKYLPSRPYNPIERE